ncbi:MAG: bifunctional rhamnulose-1-phosphate aldolase/short-chain dehydrogenase [Planctomycetota bacterium]|nr:MAG: bifunctional rhamnulose-1-phosphate aldolase/short-chain dehydrogenase [Planctomycetota bacterium]
MSEFKHVKYLWDEEKANKLSEVEQLIYRSNILGSDQNITNTGGGNTSGKVIEKDPLTGEDIDVLWVKGSGGDLRTSKKENFSSLYNKKIHALQSIYDKEEVKGYKSAAEDNMVSLYKHCTFNLNPRATSIDTPLHSLINKKHVDHMHSTAIISIAACKDQEELCQKVWGGEMGYVPWMRPGWELGVKLKEVYEKDTSIKGVLMGNHGNINWADTSKDCYDTTLDLIEKAASFLAENDKGEDTFGGQKYQNLADDKVKEVLFQFLPIARGEISKKDSFIATVHTDDLTLQFANSFDAKRLSELGTSCPDHFLRTKIKPLFLDWDPQKETVEDLCKKFDEGLVQYKKDYAKYYETNKNPDSPAMRNVNPTVILVPGIGIIGFGKNKSESRVTAEFYRTAIEVMKGAESVSEYTGIPAKEAFDIEYWALEEAKLKRMPKDAEFSRKVVAIIGAGNGIGKETAFRMAKEGAHIVCIDLSEESAKQTSNELSEIYGQGIGVAGTGISGCGPSIGLSANITDRESINAALQEAVLAYGGIDNIIVTAGVFLAPDANGFLSDDKWATTFDINVGGLYKVADEAKKLLQRQNTPATLVLTTSVNGVVSKKGSLAYDTSKAAANHLVRELAVELAPLIRVNGLAPATVVKGSTMFGRERVISSLAKYNIEFDESEDTESLRNKLAQFYGERTLLKEPITPADQAEAAYLFSSSAFSKTTGQIISVDGGLHEAFLR